MTNNIISLAGKKLERALSVPARAYVETRILCLNTTVDAEYQAFGPWGRKYAFGPWGQ